MDFRTACGEHWVSSSRVCVSRGEHWVCSNRVCVSHGEHYVTGCVHLVENTGYVVTGCTYVRIWWRALGYVRSKRMCFAFREHWVCISLVML